MLNFVFCNCYPDKVSPGAIQQPNLFDDLEGCTVGTPNRASRVKSGVITLLIEAASKCTVGEVQQLSCCGSYLSRAKCMHVATYYISAALKALASILINSN